MLTQKRLQRNFINKASISEHLYCPICLDVLDSPLRARCGHTFCCLCIQKWIEYNRSCPVCKHRIKSGLTLEKDLIPAKIVFDLEVRCVNKECCWRGKNGLLRGHFIDCKFRKRDEMKQDYSIYKIIEILQEKKAGEPIWVDE